MTLHNSVNVKSSNRHLRKLKPVIKNAINVTGSSNDESNPPHKSMVTTKQVVILCK